MKSKFTEGLAAILIVGTWLFAAPAIAACGSKHQQARFVAQVDGYAVDFGLDQITAVGVVAGAVFRRLRAAVRHLDRAVAIGDKNNMKTAHGARAT